MVAPESFVGAVNSDGVDFIGQSARSIRNEITSGYAKRCKLCGDVHTPIPLSDIELKAYVYQGDCSDCGSLRVIVKQVLSAEWNHRARRVDYFIAKCSSECCLNVPPRIPPNADCEVVEYSTEEIKEVRTVIDGHHVSYEPEITIPLCKSCHFNVHRKDEYAAFQPEQKRSEWENNEC